MKATEGLRPRALWRFFEEISRIPRESKHEERIRDYVAERAKGQGLRLHTDEAGNVVVYKPGSGKASPVILQAHMDMVCEKNRDKVHDFRKDPLTLVRDGDWVRADGTTLGADNGIGMAAMLAIMEDASLPHPNLELLFTTDEETGLTGAYAINKDLLSGKTLINLDSDYEGVFIIGCAGGRSTHCSLRVSLEDAPQGLVPVLVKITGLKGGHSGTDIRSGRGNAVKLLARFLKDISASIPAGLLGLSGGTKHNAIPREAEASILIRPHDLDRLHDLAGHIRDSFAEELAGVDEGVRIVLAEEAPGGTKVVSKNDTARVLDLLHALPHGVMHTNRAMGDIVVASTNLAVGRLEGPQCDILTSQRSIYRSSMLDVSEMTASIGRMAGARVEKLHDYPAWRPNRESRILDISKEVYERLFGSPPRAEIIHAGLECAVFAERIPGLDMISFGPTIEQAHSPSERVDIRTVEKMWVLLTALLNELS